MKPYVLIAEDESAVSELLFYNLKKEDYEVAIASDGEEAMLMIEERAPPIPVCRSGRVFPSAHCC